MVKATLGCGMDRGTVVYINPAKVKMVRDFHSPDPYYEGVNACIEFDGVENVEYVRETAEEIIKCIKADRALDFECFSKALYEKLRWL